MEVTVMRKEKMTESMLAELEITLKKHLDGWSYHHEVHDRFNRLIFVKKRALFSILIDTFEKSIAFNAMWSNGTSYEKWCPLSTPDPIKEALGSIVAKAAIIEQLKRF